MRRTHRTGANSSPYHHHPPGSRHRQQSPENSRNLWENRIRWNSSDLPPNSSRRTQSNLRRCQALNLNSSPETRDETLALADCREAFMMKTHLSSPSPVSKAKDSSSPRSNFNSLGRKDLTSIDLGSSWMEKLSINYDRPAKDEMEEEGSSSGGDREGSRCCIVRRKKDFAHFEHVHGKRVNILAGLELHTGVFDEDEQTRIVNFVHKLQLLGQQRKLKARTYSEPTKWMRGKGRVTMQFGCCYNYAVDRKGNPPGIIRDEEVDPIPPLFKDIIKRLVRWHVLPPTCVPNSCIVNMYDVGDCIPPHIDHHDFLRPFCTISFLAECNIMFGTSLKVVDAGEFSGPVSVSLPVGSVLVLNGNGADIAKHCVPAVPTKRISITFRKMDDSKLPYKFKQDPDMHGLQPLVANKITNLPVETPDLPSKFVSGQSNGWKGRGDHSSLGATNKQENGHARSLKVEQNKSEEVEKPNKSRMTLGLDEFDEFPPLGSESSKSMRKARLTR